MTAGLDSSPKRFSSVHSHQHGNIAKSKKKQVENEDKLQPGTNIYMLLVCVDGKRAGINSQNSFCIGNPALRPTDTYDSWLSSSKALYKYAGSKYAYHLSLLRCTQTQQYHSLGAFISVTAATESRHLLNWHRHYPPKQYLGMEQVKD